MKHIAIITIAFILSACTTATPNYQAYLTKKGLNPPTANTLQHCRGYGCQYIDTVELSEEEWKKISTPFQDAATSPQQEREQIAPAIGLFEQIIGAKTGSEVDIHGTFYKTGTYQLDCVDESTNTTIYLLTLQSRGLIKFHDIMAPEGRLPIIHAGRWPHQSALIREINTKNDYVVDSWFHDNGAPAEIIPLKQWKDGWKPKQNG